MDRQRLVIMNGHLAAFTAMGQKAGTLILPDPWWLAVSPDGESIAWISRSSLPASTNSGEPIVFLADDPHSPRTVKFKGRFGSQLALSARAGRIALVVVEDASPTRRLIVLDPAAPEIEADVTDLVTQRSLSEVERLRLSASGTRLVVGTRDKFAVVDWLSRTVLIEGEGRFPCLSPDANTLAIVTKDHKLVTITLKTGARRTLMEGWLTYGLGSWSPDGNFLLAAAWTSISHLKKLVAVDSAMDGFTQIMNLGEGDFGGEFVWIKRRLLSEQA